MRVLGVVQFIERLSHHVTPHFHHEDVRRNTIYRTHRSSHRAPIEDLHGARNEVHWTVELEDDVAIEVEHLGVKRPMLSKDVANHRLREARVLDDVANLLDASVFHRNVGKAAQNLIFALEMRDRAFLGSCASSALLQVLCRKQFRCSMINDLESLTNIRSRAPTCIQHFVALCAAQVSENTIEIFITCSIQVQRV